MENDLEIIIIIIKRELEQVVMLAWNQKWRKWPFLSHLMQTRHEMALIIFWKCIISRLSCFNKFAWFTYRWERSSIWIVLSMFSVSPFAIRCFSDWCSEESQSRNKIWRTICKYWIHNINMDTSRCLLFRHTALFKVLTPSFFPILLPDFLEE